MKFRRRRLLIKCVAIVLTLFLVATVVLSVPRKVEGIYSAGTLISCMCGSSHYLRFHDGMVIYYATEHEPAELFGRYEVGADGRVTVYFFPLQEDQSESVIFSISQPRLGFAIASVSKSDETSFLRRVPLSSKISEMISTQEVKRVTLRNDRSLVSTFYDSSHKELRQEIRPPRNTNAEQVGADQPATTPESKSEGNKKPKLESEGRPQ